MDSTNFLYIIVSTFYYGIVAAITFFSLFSVYILLRYGKNQLVSLVAAIVYSAFFLILLQQSYQALQSLS